MKARRRAAGDFLPPRSPLLGPSPSVPSPRLWKRKGRGCPLLDEGRLEGQLRRWSSWWSLQPALPRVLDDNLSGTSGMEVDDRVSALEQRLQLQEDELAVLKAALADALRRLRACEEQGATLRARGTPKGRAPPRLGTTASGIFARLEGWDGEGPGLGRNTHLLLFSNPLSLVCQLLKGLPTRTPLNGSGPPRRVGGYATSPSSPKKEANSGRR